MDNSIGLAPKVRLGDWIGEGWNMFAAEWKVWVLNALVLFGAVFIPVIAAVGLFLVFAPSASDSAAFPAAAFGLMLLVVVLVILAQAYLMAGMYRCAFRQLRGEPISTSDLFSAGDRFLPLLGALLLVHLLTAIGGMLCVIPGFIVLGALYFTIPLVVERNMGVIEAMTASRDATRGELLMFVLFAFLVSLISGAGVYACYVGLLVTLPLQFTIGAVAYRDCFGVAGARSFSSKPADRQHYGSPPSLPAYPEASWQPRNQNQPSPPSPPPAPAPSAVEPPSASWPGETVVQGSPPEQPAGQVVCPACQAVLPATARFCARCGRSLTEP